MSKIVIDSSVAIKWFIQETYSVQARLILNEYQMGNLDFIAPDLINAEVGDVLWKKQSLQGLAPAHALAALRLFQALTFDFVPCRDLLEDAYQSAVTHQHTVYDSNCSPCHAKLDTAMPCRYPKRRLCRDTTPSCPPHPAHFS